jgi:hypothetical protein
MFLQCLLILLVEVQYSVTNVLFSVCFASLSTDNKLLWKQRTKDKKLQELKMNFASSIIKTFTTLDTLDIQQEYFVENMELQLSIVKFF